MKKFTVAALLLALAFSFGCSQKEAQPLRMITEATFPPYEFISGQTVVGIDIEIGRAIANHLNREFQIETHGFDAVIPAIINGHADLAISAITVTDERKKHVDFSIPYLTSGIVVIYRKATPFNDIDQMRGKKIAVQLDTTSEAFALQKIGVTPERVHSPAEACELLKAGRVDFVLSDAAPAKHCVGNSPELACSDFISSEDYAVAIQKGRPDLMQAINETITELKASGQIDRWVEQFTEEAKRQQ